MKSFGFAGFALRFLFALMLVFLTYNPSPFSFSHWLLNSFPSITPQLALSGILLAIGWVIYIRATLLSLGKLGLAMATILFACIIWLFVDIGWLSVTSTSIFTWLVILIISLILAFGMSWSHIRRRMTGQVDTDRVGD